MALKREQVLAALGGDVCALRFVDANVDTVGAVQRVSFALETGGRVPGLYIPAAGSTPGPAILYCHAHGARCDIGMSELTQGRPALIAPYAPVLAAAGYAVLCLEMPCFGARADAGEDATAKARLWQGKTLFGDMLAEQVAGFDWLAAQPGVDPARIGAMGISMGGTLAWWLAAIEPRIAAAVSMCCFADMGTLIETGAHDGHGNYMTVPGLLALGRTGQVAGLAAPRPALHCIGLQDWSTPPAAFAIARSDIESCYQRAGAPNGVSFHVETDLAHAETPLMRSKVMEFLQQNL